MVTTLLNALLFFPTRAITATPADAGAAYDDLVIEADDGARLHGWWIPRAAEGTSGHVLYCHGNGGNVADRVIHAALLAELGLDVLLFDYRGYGRSSGRPSERGTYADARAARSMLLARTEVDPRRVTYLGESLGGAVALDLALEHPPAGLVLVSTFTGVRDMARRHYPLLPRVIVPDAYPTLNRIGGLRAPLLIVHGDRDEIVPLFHAHELFDAAPEPKRLVVLDGVGHNDLVTVAGSEWAAAVASFAAAPS